VIINHGNHTQLVPWIGLSSRALKSNRQQIAPYSTFCTLLLWTWPGWLFKVNWKYKMSPPTTNNRPTAKTFESPWWR
jgi:hypothetical protein